MSEEKRPLLPPEESRCSRCGGRIEETEPDVRLFHRDFPEHPHWFHEGCAAPAWELAEKIPHTWCAVRRVPDDLAPVADMSLDLPLPPPEADICAVCGGGIWLPGPHVVLLHSEVEEQVHRFHERCALPAYQLVEDDPQVWGLIHRLVGDPEAN